MSSEYENARLRLEGLLDWYKSHIGNRNEATTRLHLIDELLFECLGWDKRTDCVTEDRLNGKYTDYSLLCPRRTVIVEAKREGVYFDIPSGLTSHDYTIKSLKQDIPALGAALEQAAGYCQKSGAPFGVVTNGHQIVAFIGSRQDGLPPTEGRAVIFKSLESMVENFTLLWKLLSKSGVIERNLMIRLMGSDAVLLPVRLSEVIPSFPGVKGRNVIQADLQIMADLVFEDIIGSQQLEEEFLEKCYCPSGALSQYALISKSLLEQRYASLFPEEIGGPTLVPASLKKGISPGIFAESISRRPILILGDVGVGKTIFFRHFIQVEAKELFANAIVLYIDFGAKGAFAKDMPDYIVDEIERQLFEKCAVNVYDRSFVHAVYHGDIIRFDKGIYGSLKISDPPAYELKVIEFLDKKIRDSEHYIRDSLDHITKGRNQQVVIYLDNADQRSDDFQQELFVLSESMATNWPATIFLALRPETYQRSQQHGAMSAYHLKAFTIAPPRVDLVLAKRLAFGLEITSGRLKSSILPKGVSVDLLKVGSFLNIVKISLDQSTDIIECVDNLSSGNVRLALDSIKRLIGSGHIDTRLILEKYVKFGQYIVSLHQFLRTIIYGDNIYYDPDSSPIYNIFDVTSLDKREHFLSLILLTFIDRTGQRSSRHGFVGLDEIYNFAQGLGYLVNQIDEHIGRLWKKRLIDTSGRVKPIDQDVSTSSVRITTIGAYHFRKLPRFFVYYDAMITDTPILEREWREKILDINDIHERLDRGDIFLSYLDTCFSNLDPDKCGIDWPSHIADARANIKVIRSVLSN